ALTMDRWLLRSWGRWTGSLINERPDQVKAKTDELRSVVAELRADPEATKAIEAVLGQKITSRNMGALAEAVLKASQKPENRDVMNATPAGEKLRLVGNSLAKWVDGQKEAPANGNERNQIRAVFGDMLKEMQKSNPDMTMADMQALLWYSERRLYDKAKAKEDVSAGYEPDEAPDYANAAASLAESLGIDPAAINAIKGADYGTNSAGGAGRAAGAGDSQAGSEGGAGSGSVLNQGPKGTYNPGTQVVTLFETADQSTFAHESAHHFLEMTSLMAQSPGAPSGLVRDLKKTLKWMGTNPKEWASMTMEQKRNMHEKYARGFEGYLRDGVAPTKALENSFAAFKGWLTKIYQSADALGAPINDEVRGVFDRMLGGGASVGPVSAAMRGALPVLGGGEQQGVYNQFAGERSVQTPLNAQLMTEAIDKLAAGENPEQVRVDTGWFMGKDGKMRYEISDKNAVAKPMNMPKALQRPRTELRQQAVID
ncbi:MAG: LPD23 domain-containing protein, partial [Caldilineaceae bacterium]